MSRIIRVVKETFRKYPMIANSTVYGTMCVGAEFSQQILTKRILVKKNKILKALVVKKKKKTLIKLGLIFIIEQNRTTGTDRHGRIRSIRYSGNLNKSEHIIFLVINEKGIDCCIINCTHLFY